MAFRSDKYVVPFFLGTTGLIAIASPLFLNLGSQMPNYMASQRTISDQELQRLELEERKRTSNKINETGLTIPGSTLTLRDYLDDPNKLPRLRKTDLNRYGNRQAWVFDASDQCIGRIINRQFISKHINPTTCKELPNDR